MEPSERVRVEVGPSAARRLDGERPCPLRRRRGTGADETGALDRHPRLTAWGRSAAARLPGALVTFVALACLALGLSALLAALLGASCDVRVVCACALAPALACCVGQVASTRGAAATTLACLAAVTAGIVLARAQLAQEAQGLAQALAGSGGAEDATALLAALVAVLVTMASFLSYACQASWVMALAAVPLLVMAALAGRACPPAAVALLAAHFALAIPHDRVARRGGRPAASLALVVGASLVGAAVGVALAATCMDAMSAPARALAERASQALGQLGAPQDGGTSATGAAQGPDEDPTSRTADAAWASVAAQAGAAGSQADADASAGSAGPSSRADSRSDVATTGVIRRDALGTQEEPAHEVTLDHEPEGAVYLRQFTGADYADGVWGAAPDGQDGADAFLGFDGAAHARLAQLAADNPQDSAEDAEAFVLRTLAENVTYTTQMAPIPEGVDIPEYVLFDGHEGYCQHFATTATLLLRALGVPARYVAGYAAPASAFAQGDDGLWHAWLDGRSAHAWVEVWDDAVGAWQVLETTPAGTPAAPEVDFGATAPGRDTDEAQTRGGDAESSTAQATDVQATGAGTADPAQADAGSAGTATAASEGAATGVVSSAGASAGLDEATAAGASAGKGQHAAGASSAAGAGAGGAGDARASGGAASAGGEGTSAAAGDGSQALGLVRRLLARALAVAAAVVTLLALAGLLLRRALRARRRRILDARESATARELLAQAVAALRFAGIPVAGADDEALARTLTEAAGLARADADHLMHEALRCAFGPEEARLAPADERCQRAYRAACEAARARLRGPWAWWFAYGRAWL